MRLFSFTSLPRLVLGCIGIALGLLGCLMLMFIGSGWSVLALSLLLCAPALTDLLPALWVELPWSRFKR